MGSRLPVLAVDVAKLAKAAGWSGFRVATAVAVAKAESGWDAYAIGVVGSETRVVNGVEEPNPAYRSLDVGLWQNNTYWWPVAVKDMLDPAKNAGQAFKIWNDGYTKATGSFADKVHAGWLPWAVYKSGAYEAFMPEAVDVARQIGAL